jgi:hypothetical protein
MSMVAPRPVGVAVVAIIGFIQAIIGGLGGIALLVERNDLDFRAHVGESKGTITWYAVLAIVIAAITFLVAYALWSGADWARIVVTVVEVLYIAGGVYWLFAWGGIYLWSGIVQILIALLVLWLLYNPRADDFFTGRRA